MSKAQMGWIWLAAGVAAAYFGWTNRRIFFVNDITTGENSAYPALRSRVYYAEIPRAMAAAEQAVKQMPKWEIASRDSDNDILEITVAVGPFTDDVTIYFFALGHGQTRVTIRSRARLGRGDLGVNAAHVRRLQAAMDDRLNTGAAF